MAKGDHILRSFGLSRRRPTAFDFAPDSAGRAGLAEQAGLLALPRLRLSGEIHPVGKADFSLSARLEAVAVQACVVTLEPVETSVSGDVARRYLAEIPAPTTDESEIPEDVDAEVLPDVIDLQMLAAEELLLALPLYPRSPGAELAATAFGGQTGEDDEPPERPFAALGALKRDLAGGSE